MRQRLWQSWGKSQLHPSWNPVSFAKLAIRNGLTYSPPWMKAAIASPPVPNPAETAMDEPDVPTMEEALLQELTVRQPSLWHNHTVELQAVSAYGRTRNHPAAVFAMKWMDYMGQGLQKEEAFQKVRNDMRLSRLQAFTDMKVAEQQAAHFGVPDRIDGMTARLQAEYQRAWANAESKVADLRRKTVMKMIQKRVSAGDPRRFTWEEMPKDLQRPELVSMWETEPLCAQYFPANTLYVDPAVENFIAPALGLHFRHRLAEAQKLLMDRLEANPEEAEVIKERLEHLHPDDWNTRRLFLPWALKHNIPGNWDPPQSVLMDPDAYLDQVRRTLRDEDDAPVEDPFAATAKRKPKRKVLTRMQRKQGKK